MALPADHLATGLARWVQEASGLGAGQVVLEQASRGNRPAGPHLTIARVGTRWVGPAAAYTVGAGSAAWTVDFATFTPGEAVAVDVLGTVVWVSTDPGDADTDARDAWLAALADLRLDEILTAAAGAGATVDLALTSAAPRGAVDVSAVLGCTVTPGPDLGPAEIVSRGAVMVWRVAAANFPDLLAAEDVLSRVGNRGGSPAWIGRSRSYLVGCLGVVRAVGDVQSAAVLVGAEYETHAWADLTIALVARGPADDTETLALVDWADDEPPILVP